MGKILLDKGRVQKGTKAYAKIHNERASAIRLAEYNRKLDFENYEFFKSGKAIAWGMALDQYIDSKR